MLETKYQAPQTMVGVEINVDFDEYQERYRAFTTFGAQVITEAQQQIHGILNKYIEGGNPIARSRVASMVPSIGGT